jgi:hypothetical protein
VKKVVSAQLKEGELRDRYEEEEPDEGKSEYLRGVLEDGFRYRDENIYQRVDLPDTVVEHLEQDRRGGETREAAVKRAAEEAVERRERDALDAVEASEELREMVASVREEDEDLESVLRRLIREGAESSTTLARKRKRAQQWAEAAVGSFLLFALVLAFGEPLLRFTLPIIPISGEGLFGGALFVVIMSYVITRISWLISWSREN